MEKYIKGKKYKLGDYFVIDNKVIKVVTGEACRDCAFIDSDECHTVSCDGIIFKHVANIPKVVFLLVERMKKISSLNL